jgi:chromosome segregation ATPase
MTIDSLRKDLAASRGRGAEDITGMTISLNALQSENSGLREQFEVELQAKNQQIYALEHTLHAQEQIVENMRSEMDQLQSGMESSTERRREDFEDLQQEMMQIESRAMKQDREIIALKMQLEESKLEHKSEVVRLKDVIVTMEKESPLAKTVAELQRDDKMLEVRERLEQLKMRNTNMQEENLKLGGRLERAIIEIKSFEAERNHSEEMDKENGLLRGQVKELEKILGGARKQKQRGAPASPARTAIDKENNVTSKDKSTKKGSKGSLRGLFKRRTHGSDEMIKEEPSVEMIKEEKDEGDLVA